jgi:hypothetical protein
MGVKVELSLIFDRLSALHVIYLKSETGHELALDT